MFIFRHKNQSKASLAHSMILLMLIVLIASCTTRISVASTSMPTGHPQPATPLVTPTLGIESTQSVDLATPTSHSIPSSTHPIEATLPSEWETYTNPQGCGYAISYPREMESGTLGWMYSWILRFFDLVLPPAGVAENYIYVSVMPDDFQFKSGEIGIVLNYDPVEAETLLNIQVGESKSLRADADTEQWLTYTRLPDTIINDRAAQTYESSQPEKFPRKQIRYYLLVEDCTYQIGGYLNTMNLDQPGVITKELFDQIIATFRLIP